MGDAIDRCIIHNNNYNGIILFFIGSNGTYKIDGISPGDYTLRIVARDPRRPSSEKAVLRSRIKMRSSDVCVVHLVNDGITVEGNTVIVDFLTTGNVEPTGYLCSLDRARFVECKYTILCFY